MIRTNQHRHNLDTRAHESLQPTPAKPCHAFEDWLRRQDGEQRAKTDAEPSPEQWAQALNAAPCLQAAMPEEAASPAGLDTPTPAAAATAQAHLRMSLPLAPQAQAWVFDLSASNLPVQRLTLTRTGQGLALSIQSQSGANGQQIEHHLPRLKQRLADKVIHVDLHDDHGRVDPDEGCIAP